MRMREAGRAIIDQVQPTGNHYILVPPYPRPHEVPFHLVERRLKGLARSNWAAQLSALARVCVYRNDERFAHLSWREALRSSQPTSLRHAARPPLIEGFEKGCGAVCLASPC